MKVVVVLVVAGEVEESEAEEEEGEPEAAEGEGSSSSSGSRFLPLGRKWESRSPPEPCLLPRDLRLAASRSLVPGLPYTLPGDLPVLLGSTGAATGGVLLSM